MTEHFRGKLLDGDRVVLNGLTGTLRDESDPASGGHVQRPGWTPCPCAPG
jgi:hypothetical protein